MGAGHVHATPTNNERTLWIVLGLTVSFMLTEVAGAVITGSLALLSDAAHMLTDSAALAIALFATRMSRRPADNTHSFGYHRFEIIAAAFNALLLFGIAIYIMSEAWRRMNDPAEIAAEGMMAIAFIGLLVNLAGMRLLHAGKEHNLNMRGAYLEVWADMLGSLGVVIGSIVILFTGWMWVDTVIAIGIGLWVVPRTWKLLKASLHILLEGVPEGMDIEKIRGELRRLPGVASIHDLHIWALSSGKPSLTVHLVLQPDASSDQVLAAAREHLAHEYGITHITVQCESKACDQVDAAFHFPDAEPTFSPHPHDPSGNEHVRHDDMARRNQDSG